MIFFLTFISVFHGISIIYFMGGIAPGGVRRQFSRPDRLLKLECMCLGHYIFISGLL